MNTSPPFPNQIIPTGFFLGIPLVLPTSLIPYRSPVRLRREVRGRYGAGYVPPTRSPYRRNPSSEPSRRDRSSSREAPVGRQPSVAAQRERAQMDVDTSQQKGFLGIPQQKGDAPMEWSPTAGQTQPPNNEMPSEPDRELSILWKLLLEGLLQEILPNVRIDGRLHNVCLTCRLYNCRSSCLATRTHLIRGGLLLCIGASYRPKVISTFS